MIRKKHKEVWKMDHVIKMYIFPIKNGDAPFKYLTEFDHISRTPLAPFDVWNFCGTFFSGRT